MKQKEGHVDTNTNLKLNRSHAVDNTSESDSFLSVSPPLLGASDNICNRMSDMLLDDEVSSYIELYRKKMVMSDNDSLKLSHGSSVQPASADHTICRGTFLTLQDSPTSSSNINFLSPIHGKRTEETNGED